MYQLVYQTILDGFVISEKVKSVCFPFFFIRGSRGGGGQGVWTPLKNHNNIGFLNNTGPDPLKNHKAT